MAKRSNQYISHRQLTSNPKLTGQKADYKDHTDPKYVGPGKWHDIHQWSWRAQTPEGKQFFKTFMSNTCNDFPCSTCRTHCQEYMKNHPMEEYENVLVEVGTEKLPLGLFVWAWKFHNVVNARLKKPQMTWDTAYNMYSGKEGLMCSKACLHAEEGIAENEPENTQAVQQVLPASIQPILPVKTVRPIAPVTNRYPQFQQIPGINR